MHTLLQGTSAIFAGLLVGGAALGAHHSVQELDKATARQCATADWPRSAVSDDRHRDFCKAYGYPTPERGSY